MPDYYKIEGIDELLAKIKEVGDDKKKRTTALRFLRVAARDIRNSAREKVPVYAGKYGPKYWNGEDIPSGALKRSIGVITSKKRTYPNVLVGPRSNNTFQGYHGHLIEKGFYNKAAKKHIPAKPFMRPAYEENKERVSAKVAGQMARFIQKEIDRLSR